MVDNSPPQPPSRYNPEKQEPRFHGQPPDGGRDSEFSRIHRLVVVAQVLAVLSLFTGIIVSIAATMAATIALRSARLKTKTAKQDEQKWDALSRSAAITLGMAVATLALNAIAAAILYPIVADMLQSEPYASLINETGNSTWG